MISSLADALTERGYDALTDVQEAVTEPQLVDADLLVSAQTGSGKTVGFGLAIAPTLMGADARFGPAAAPLALIVAPTRELAMQVARELEWLYGKTGALVATCIGGMDARTERRALERGAHIVVGTPGRLRDHIMRGALELGDIRAIVLDEADEMLDLGFREDLEFMLAEAPESKRTLMFSATVPAAIAELAKRYQRDAVRVMTQSKGSQHADITYQAIQVTQADIEHAILNLLRFHDAQTAIVFANTRAAVARLTARLANRGFSVVSISGELSQDERSHALQALRDGRAKVCVATDVAARGIDLPNLELVVHADLPQNTEALLHRSGRTGRAGRKGISALIVPERAANKASRLLKWAKIQAEWIPAPSPDDIQARDEARLLADTAWTEAPAPDEADFAARLLEQFTPSQIATACLRLYRAQLSAPEELNTRPSSAPTERPPFGPSAWVSLSVGRAQNAEARWLLPLLCRAGGLEKGQIGKIRVQETETVVEIAEAGMATLTAALGPDGLLENDIRARVMSGPPSGQSAPRHAKPKPAARTGGPDRSADRKSAPRPNAPARDKAATGAKFSASGDGYNKTGKTPQSDVSAPVAETTAPGTGPKPKHAASKPRPAGKGPQSPARRRPDSEKDARKSGKETGAKHAAKPLRSRPAKPGHAADAKPKKAFRPDASDPSKPMGRRGGKVRNKARGGDAVPRRTR
ncbi:DEAD/DEAH box helicase [Roseivivax sp. CAU 1753]